MDLRRHVELFDPEEFTTPITIIGVGATGSWVAYMLAKLGIENITIYDFDKVEAHNIPNQLFGLSDVGEFKVDATSRIIEEQTGIKVKTKSDRYVGQRLSGIVIMQVDSMEERKRIFDANIAMQPQIQLMVESRMGLDMGRIYNVNPVDLSSVKRYQESLYGDEESEVSACGASMTVITSALNIASTVVRQVINHHNDIALPREIMFDYIYNQVIVND